MKFLLCLYLSLISYDLLAQSQKPRPITHQEVQQQGRLVAKFLEWGYQTPVEGWVIQKGDSLQLGQGSLPGKEFANLYDNLESLTTTAPHQAPSVQYSGQRVCLKELGIQGSEATGFNVYGLVSAGTKNRYYLDIDKAFESGELLPPVKYRPSALASPAVPVVVADELIKLKTLLDAGTITQAEHDARRKKLLDH